CREARLPDSLLDVGRQLENGGVAILASQPEYPGARVGGKGTQTVEHQLERAAEALRVECKQQAVPRLRLDFPEKAQGDVPVLRRNGTAREASREALAQLPRKGCGRRGGKRNAEK